MKGGQGTHSPLLLMEGAVIQDELIASLLYASKTRYR